MESDRVLSAEADKAGDNVGRNAKIISQMVKALARDARRHQCSIILVNQPRANIGGFGGDISAGPKLMQHATNLKIQMAALGKDEDRRQLQLPDEDEPVIVSVKTAARVPRLKNGLPGRVAEIFINRVGTPEYGPPGFDDADSYLTVGYRRDIIKLGGSYYTFPDGHRVNGRIAAATYLRENPDAVKAIRALIPFDVPTDLLEDDE